MSDEEKQEIIRKIVGDENIYISPEELDRLWEVLKEIIKLVTLAINELIKEVKKEILYLPKGIEVFPDDNQQIKCIKQNTKNGRR